MDKSIPAENLDAEASQKTAEALSELADLLENHDADSAEVRAFLAARRHMTEFTELAREALRLESAAGAPVRPAAVAEVRRPTARPAQGTGMQHVLSLAASFAGLIVFVSIAGSAAYFAIDARTTAAKLTQEQLARAEDHKKFDTQIALAKKDKEKSDALALRASIVCDDGLRHLSSDAFLWDPKIKADPSGDDPKYRARKVRLQLVHSLNNAELIQALEKIALAKDDVKLSKQVVFLLGDIYREGRNLTAYDALVNISAKTSSEEIRNAVQICFTTVPSRESVEAGVGVSD